MGTRATEIRKGQVIEKDGDLLLITEYTHKTPGNLRAIITIKTRSLMTGQTQSIRLGSGDTVDVAYLDATFYADGEIPGRDMSTFPHPFIVTTMERLAGLPASERAKVRFIHLNHTNPALWDDSDARRAVEAAGFRVAAEGEVVDLGR